MTTKRISYIKYLRELSGWTQEQLSDRTNIAVMRISRYENMKIIPHQRHLLRLAKVFDIADPNELLAEVDVISTWIPLPKEQQNLQPNPKNGKTFRRTTHVRCKAIKKSGMRCKNYLSKDDFEIGLTYCDVHQRVDMKEIARIRNRQSIDISGIFSEIPYRNKQFLIRNDGTKYIKIPYIDRAILLSTGVYIFKLGNTPLYVGKGNILGLRIFSKDNLIWALDPEVSLELEIFSDENEALEREEELIRTLCPIYNIAHNKL